MINIILAAIAGFSMGTIIGAIAFIYSLPGFIRTIKECDYWCKSTMVGVEDKKSAKTKFE